MVNVINCGNASLPRSIDVNVQVNKPQAEQTTDLSVAVFVQAGGGFGFGADRLAFYTQYEDVADDARVSPEGLRAAQAFFAQSPRALTMAIGQVATGAKAGYLRTGAAGSVADLAAVTTGSFALSIDGLSADVTGVTFAGLSTYADIAAALQTKIRAANVATGFAQATVTANAVGQFTITSGTTGDTSQVSILAPVNPAVGVDISGPGFLNGRTGVVQPGYVPGTFTSELDLIAEAARCGGRFVYGWALDASYRDTQDQVDAASWAQARTAYMPMVSNSPLAWDPSSIDDIGPTLRQLGTYRTSAWFHDQAQYYPDMAHLAGELSVNFAQRDSTRTAKFKDLVGIPTVGLTPSQWVTLNSKGYNTFTLTGNTSRVTRDGDTSNPTWYIDDLINLDNYKEELSAAVYNVFVRNKKVPMSVIGQTMIQDAITQISERYKFNGAFADRRVLDLTAAAGYRIEPAYTIVPTPLELVTDAERAARVGPPFVVNVNLAGAIHSIAINVNAYS